MSTSLCEDGGEDTSMSNCRRKCSREASSRVFRVCQSKLPKSRRGPKGKSPYNSRPTL